MRFGRHDRCLDDAAIVDPEQREGITMAKMPGYIGINTAGAANIQFAFVFRVEIDKDISFQKIGLQAKCTKHAGFFIYGNKHFDSRMGNAG